MISHYKNSVIFDYGGVIGIDSTPSIIESVHKRFGIPQTALIRESRKLIIESQIDGITDCDFWKTLSAKLEIRYSDRLKSTWLDAFERNYSVNGKIIQLVRELKNSGNMVCILSNAPNIYDDSPLKRKLDNEFSLVLYSYQAKVRKPDKKIYEKLLEKLETDISHDVMIDDREENLVVPRKLGMKTILYTEYSYLISELVKFGVIIND